MTEQLYDSFADWWLVISLRSRYAAEEEALLKEWLGHLARGTARIPGLRPEETYESEEE